LAHHQNKTKKNKNKNIRHTPKWRDLFLSSYKDEKSMFNLQISKENSMYHILGKKNEFLKSTSWANLNIIDMEIGKYYKAIKSKSTCIK
jgi:hypothetical protein